MTGQNFYLFAHRRSSSSEALNELKHKQKTEPQADSLVAFLIEISSK